MPNTLLRSTEIVQHQCPAMSFARSIGFLVFIRTLVPTLGLSHSQKVFYSGLCCWSPSVVPPQVRQRSPPLGVPSLVRVFLKEKDTVQIFLFTRLVFSFVSCRHLTHKKMIQSLTVCQGVAAFHIAGLPLRGLPLRTNRHAGLPDGVAASDTRQTSSATLISFLLLALLNTTQDGWIQTAPHTRLQNSVSILPLDLVAVPKDERLISERASVPLQSNRPRVPESVSEISKPALLTGKPSKLSPLLSLIFLFPPTKPQYASNV